MEIEHWSDGALGALKACEEEVWSKAFLVRPTMRFLFSVAMTKTGGRNSGRDNDTQRERGI